MARTITCTLICRFLIVGNIFRLETCMNSLVKVPPYSKLNFQGKHFFTQNWCNITLNDWWLILLQDWSGLYAWLLMNDRSMNDDWLLNERNGMNNTSTNLQKKCFIKLIYNCYILYVSIHHNLINLFSNQCVTNIEAIVEASGIYSKFGHSFLYHCTDVKTWKY